MKARKLLAIPLFVVALVISGCSGSGSGGGTTDQPTQQPITAQDINAQDRGNLQQGGELRLPAEGISPQWNPLQVDGNTGAMNEIRAPMTPGYFDYDAKGLPIWNKNYLAAEPTAVDTGGNLVVTYKLNPKAVWNDGRPIDVTDFIATWKANNGSNKDFQVITTQGYDAITSIKAGADKFEVIMTYKGAYPDWTATFSTVSRAEGMKDPDTFNKGWLDVDKIDAWFSGPFKLEKYDKTQKIVTEVPNDKWWGDKPLLAKLSFREIANDATAAAYTDNSIDSFDIGADPDAYQRAKQVADGVIRTAAGPNFRHFTFNTTAGLLKDKAIRQAIVRSLDRQQIGESDLAGIDWPARPLNNHIFMENQAGYEDNAAAVGLTYDPAKAKADLDAMGWKVGADGIREKGGKKLEIKFAQLIGVRASENEGLQAQAQLKDVGIKLTLVPTPTSKFDDGTLLGKGTFELVAFTWSGTPYPFANIKQLYGTGQPSNFAKLSMPAVDALIKKIDVENDPTARIKLANDADKIIWENVHTLPLYQRPELIAQKAKLANYGAPGLSSVVWENVGYQK